MENKNKSQNRVTPRPRLGKSKFFSVKKIPNSRKNKSFDGNFSTLNCVLANLS